MDTRQFFNTNDVNSPTVVPFSPVLPQEGSMWKSFQREENINQRQSDDPRKSTKEVAPIRYSAAENSRNFDGMMT